MRQSADMGALSASYVIYAAVLCSCIVDVVPLFRFSLKEQIKRERETVRVCVCVREREIERKRYIYI